jgi:NAD(P)-dependent dehydrogenase (short-subunit alcohol dehydrogenase family)
MIPDIHKTVIMTGASQGIGAGLVKAFLDRRYNVVRVPCSQNDRTEIAG